MAESGWDFSSRWLNDTMKLESNIISEMIPSDLNTLMGLSE
jgi:alpha,alpha-trehalase